MKSSDLLLPAALVLLLSACTLQAGIEQSGLDYNKAADNIDKQLLLLNIVRAYRGESMTFTGVTEMNGSFSVRLSASPDVPFGGDADASFGVDPTASYETSPSTKVVPLATADFQKGISTGVTPEIMRLLWERGWPKELLLYLLVEKVVMKVPSPKSGENATSQITALTTDSCWQYVEQSTQKVLHKAKALWEKTRERGFDFVCEIYNEPDDSDQFEEFQEFLVWADLEVFEYDGKEEPVGPVVGLEDLATLKTVADAHDGDLEVKEEEGTGKYYLAKPGTKIVSFVNSENFKPYLRKGGELITSGAFSLQFQNLSVEGADAARKSDISTTGDGRTASGVDPEIEIETVIHLRSPQAMIFYLGQILRAENPKKGESRELLEYQQVYFRNRRTVFPNPGGISDPIDCDPRTYSLAELRKKEVSGDEAAKRRLEELRKFGCVAALFVGWIGEGDAEVAVTWRGKRYFVPADEEASDSYFHTAGRSLMAMALVKALFNMNTSRQDLPTTQTVITVGAGS